MTKDDFKTNVVFRKFREGDILALFPDDSDSFNVFVGSYQHVGQHSEADYSGCMRRTKPAKENEYKDLFEELKSIGYNLNVIKRRQK